MPQQRAPLPRNQHDHRGIGAREVLRLAGSALHHMAGALGVARRAAHPTKPMPRAPVQQPARMRQDRGLRLRDTPPHRPQVDELAQRIGQQRHRIVRRADVDAEHRPLRRTLTQQPKEHPGPTPHAQRARRRAGDVDRLRHPLLQPVHQVAATPHRDEQRLRILQPRGDPAGVLPPRANAVERARRVNVRAAGLDQGHGSVCRTATDAPDRAMCDAGRQPLAPPLPGQSGEGEGQACTGVGRGAALKPARGVPCHSR